MVTNIIVTKTATLGGALLVVVGLLGFAAPGFMGMHLSALHNVLLLLSGVVAIYFGVKATPAAARAFCLVLECYTDCSGWRALWPEEWTSRSRSFREHWFWDQWTTSFI